MAWHFGRVRPQFLTAAAVALALVSASNVYTTVQAGVPADSAGGAPASAGISAAAAPDVPGPPAGAASGKLILPRALTPGAGQAPSGAAAAPEGALVDAPAGPAADLPGTPATPSAAPAEAAAPAAPPAVAAPAIDPELDGEINAIIEANSAYALGVSLIDLSDGVVHEYGEQGKFVAASTAKILAAAAYYNLVETGRASLTDPLGASSAGVQIRQMVQQSNNDSWALILDAVGQQELSDYAEAIGIDYDRTVNLLTPTDMARTLALLYTGKLLNPSNTAQLLSYMQNTNYETLIPAAAPPDVDVFHKYGLLFGNLHDASVLAQDGRAFVFVVYTRGRDLTDMTARARIIQQLTRTVTAALF
ncbi:serine hydrolase [Pseudarthrobacter sp. S9]|uniref:serine hydrolase n=1 Tax=Pseudarthrobacter sp. S9 TaxID=3418421 RepID=UPI003D023C46